MIRLTLPLGSREWLEMLATVARCLPLVEGSCLVAHSSMINALLFRVFLLSLPDLP